MNFQNFHGYLAKSDFENCKDTIVSLHRFEKKYMVNGSTISMCT